MPLATIVGLPCCGKTQVAVELTEFLRGRVPDREVVLINEELLHIRKAEGYKDAAAEKLTREALKTRVNHVLNAKTLVILDSLNYIKGFRYELYCAARAEGTQHCVIWVEGDRELSRQVNQNRLDGYPTSLFDDLCSRFEAPNESNRWDRPLLRRRISLNTQSNYGPLDTQDDSATSIESEALLKHNADQGLRLGTYQQILEALVESKAPTVAQATSTAPHSQADTLYLLGVVTQKVVMSLHERQRVHGVGEDIKIPEAGRSLLLTRLIGLPELKRLQRQFLKQAGDWGATVTQGKQQISREQRIANAFLEHISTNI